MLLRVNFFKKHSYTKSMAHKAFLEKRTEAWASCGNAGLEAKVDQNLTVVLNTWSAEYRA